jgi:Ca2+-binding EF-hand superfamily protein
MHSKLDLNRDGQVNKNEFISRINQFKIRDISLQEFGKIFDCLDHNGDGQLSVSEFAMFLTGSR